MKILFVMLVAAVPLLATRVSWAQNGNMMGGGVWGGGWMEGYGWMWMPVVLVVVVAGVVAWIVKRGDK